MEKSAFELLHPKLRYILYKMGWEELRPIQVDAIHEIFNTNKNLIISAQTASGKTEAAFLPILSQIVDRKDGGISAIYVGPLKALINDQFERLEVLCKTAEIPVFKWHGDVGSAPKKKFLKNPSGVLLITPESIESLFINHSDELSNLFRSLSFIVIDEMHSFIGTERGAHLKSLLSRAMHKSKGDVRIVGLSATIGDPELAKQWLIPRDPASVVLITDPNEQKGIRYLIRGYLPDNEPDDDNADKETRNPSLLEDIISYFDTQNKGNSLIFINSRQMLEYYTDAVKRTVKMRHGNPENIQIYYSGIAKTGREDTERSLKSHQHTVAFCSSALEMGIDIGNVSCIGHIGAPWSVNSLAQRLGRSGRKDGELSTLIMFISQSGRKEDIIDRLYPEVLQAVAMSELMLKTKWCEPPQTDLFHFSTLIQQILSVIKEHGGATVQDLFDTLVTEGTFHNVTQEDFIQILHGLKIADLVDQDSSGLVILGLKGEKIVKNRDFYSAFVSAIELDVICSGKKIGSVQYVPDLETRQFLILAGKRWEIKDLDLKKEKMYVIPSKGGKTSRYSGGLGSDIHPRVREKMRELLTSNYIPEYLDENAKLMLKEVQAAALEAGLTTGSFVIDGPYTYWFTWTGSAKHRTLYILGKAFGELNVEDLEIALKFKGVSPSQIQTIYHSLLENCPSAEEIAATIQNISSEKYDQYLSKNLLIAGFAKKYIDTNLSPP
jgi:ATP-dependent helicase Lhr and Lhr-like helicase